MNIKGKINAKKVEQKTLSFEEIKKEEGVYKVADNNLDARFLIMFGAPVIIMSRYRLEVAAGWEGCRFIKTDETVEINIY